MVIRVTVKPQSSIISSIKSKRAIISSINTGSSADLFLGQLKDVDASSPDDQDALVYDANTNLYVIKPVVVNANNVANLSGSDKEVLINDNGKIGSNSAFTFDKANGRLSISNVRINGIYDLVGANLTTTSNTEQILFTFSASRYNSAKLVIQANDGDKRQIAEILLIHDGTEAHITEYAIIKTDDNLFDIDADLDSGNVRIKTTSSTSNTTNYKVLSNLILA